MISKSCDEIVALHRQKPLQRGAAVVRRCRRRSSRASPSGGLPRRTCARSGRGRCPRPRNCAPSARRPACRHWRARRCRAPRRPRPSSVRNASSSAGSSIAARPGQHLAVGAVDRDHVAFAEHAAVRRRSASARARLNRMPDAPTTQGRPRPRPITAAWLVMPPRSVRTAGGRMHAAHVLGRGLAPDQDAGLAARGAGLRRRRR